MYTHVLDLGIFCHTKYMYMKNESRNWLRIIASGPDIRILFSSILLWYIVVPLNGVLKVFFIVRFAFLTTVNPSPISQTNVIENKLTRQLQLTR